MTERRTILLIGGGHSHVQILESLAHEPLANAEVRVVVDRAVAIYSGMVPGFVAGQYSARELEIDVPDLCRWAGVACTVEPVVCIDASGKTLTLADGRCLPYDLASINIGSTVAGLDSPGIRQFAIPTRPIAELVRRTDEVVDRASRKEGNGPFRLLVVGGGAGGVELAFTLSWRLQQVAREPVETRLIHAGGQVLEGYPESLVRRIEHTAGRRGIQIHTGRRVVAARDGGVTLSGGEEWDCDSLIWVTGAVGHGLPGDSGLDTDDRGFVLTRSTLQVTGHDDLFAVGDCASLIDYPDTPRAGVYAVRQGPFLDHNLRARLADRPLRGYMPQRDFLTLLNLGDGTAAGAKRGFSFQGRWVMLLKDWIDRRFMRRFQVGAKADPHWDRLAP